jgi:hypothetical protein
MNLMNFFAVLQVMGAICFALILFAIILDEYL